ncbi:unnamed protein product [Alopecurus aequalis]
MIPEWASLPPELVEGIADRVLSTTGGVDAYMDMRAACSSWRSAIAKPSPIDALGDLRFRPRHWVLVDVDPPASHDDDDARLFLHIPTGRFRRLHLPALNFVAGAADGLLVLGDMYPPHLARLLNPFTGDMLHFAAPLPQYFTCTSVKQGGSHSTLVLLRWGTVYCAAPNSDCFTETEEAVETRLVSIVNFQDDVYCADAYGGVFKLVAQCNDELVVIPEVLPNVVVYTEGGDSKGSGSEGGDSEGDDSEGSDNEGDGSKMRTYLVESAGELLLVRYVDQTLKVFRFDIEHKLLEEVESLSGRALFLGEERCVSVDAAQLPSVDGDYIYILDYENVSMSDSEDMSVSDSEDMSVSDSDDKCDMCVYNLRGDMVDTISSKHFCARPFSLVQVLLRYCDWLPKL